MIFFDPRVDMHVLKDLELLEKRFTANLENNVFTNYSGELISLTHHTSVFSRLPVVLHVTPVRFPVRALLGAYFAELRHVVSVLCVIFHMVQQIQV